MTKSLPADASLHGTDHRLFQSRVVRSLLSVLACACIPMGDLRADERAATTGPHVVAAPIAAQGARAQACMKGALRRPTQDTSALESQIEAAYFAFDQLKIQDVLAQCRAAIVDEPGNTQVIVAHYLSAQLFYLMLYGETYTLDEALLLEEAASNLEDPGLSDLARGMTLFHLGSAYQYGIGTAVDVEKAKTFYRRGADGGDPIAARELQLLEASNQQ